MYNNYSKDPWLAVNLSMFFPGLGQFYAGNYLQGFLFFNGQILWIVLTVWHIFGAKGNTVMGFICLGITIIFYFISLIEVHFSVYKKRNDPKLEKIPRKHKNLWFAIFITRILPGLGHLYLQKPILGLLLLTSGLIIIGVDDFYSNLLLVSPLITALSIYHIYLIFPHKPRGGRWLLIFIMTGVIFTLGVTVNYYPQWLEKRFDKFLIPSKSMQPTLQINDIVFVQKFPDYVPTIGDIIVFTPSENIKQADPDVSDYYIKRIIATPGKKVKIKQGQVYLNDTPIQEPYIRESPQYQLKSMIIPADHYLVLGDNRNDSFDSHIWGLLPRDVIVGQAYKIGWPPKRIQSLDSHY
ncbi:signal peptidase I [Crocosphaera subtropica ATCC 51142]|uniref:Signal peptidase I n=1 Tax=Crocosphaera subtropica (strain ATCC 51142 / BH68) TaxID=43989 RepID=B1X0M3_CROS5|nr:signal peptidase I [Crocosphaera subtropica]ACB51312.1 signal peptidase I [Crocosphaera subtropica ATCC 51142]